MLSAAHPPTRRAILVFGAATTADAKPRPALRRRLDEALRLWRESPAATLVVSGGATNGVVEAEVMRAWLVARGVPSEQVLMEARSRSTLENVLFSLPLIAAFDHLTLVSERYHLPRCRALVAGATRHLSITLEASAAGDDLHGLERLLRPITELVKRARDVPDLWWRRTGRTPPWRRDTVDLARARQPRTQK